MASCELDYRLSSTCESMEYDDAESSEDETRLRIVEDSVNQQGTVPRTLIRSLSVGDGSYDHSSVGSTHNASDAVESLLLLGERPVFCAEQQDTSGTGSDPETFSGGMSPPFPRFTTSSNNVEQRMMVNYYQKMRERNNEASKRCRLKRRIKQDSLDKTRLLLESHKEALSHRVAKLHRLKNILSDACRTSDKEEGKCDCKSVCNLIKAANREMPDLLDLSNVALLKKSRKVRETNIEELLGGVEATYRLSDLRPLKRGPRKQVEDATRLLVDTLAPPSPSQALDLSTSAGIAAYCNVKPETPTEEKKFNQVTFVSKGYTPLAPKASSNLPNLPIRKIIVDNPSLPRISSPLTPLFQGGGGASNLQLGASNFQIGASSLQLGGMSPSKSTISIPAFNGTNTIILTPLGQHGLPSTIFSLPSSSSLSSSIISPPASTSSINTTSIPSFSLPGTKQEAPEPIVIKSEPDLGIEAMEEQDPILVKQETAEKDPTTTCCASGCNLGTCSQELIDLNTLTQMLDLVTMEPKIAGDLTASEKYIIKSRLKIEFWKAEETPSFICSAHRRSIVHNTGPQVSCSVCAKRKSKKLDMYFITYRMAVEFYMTAGKYLAIGRLACSSCKTKGLKGLDFSNSYLVPDFGHPLEQQARSGEDNVNMGREDEDEEVDEKKTEKREVILKPIPPTQDTRLGKLATIQPLPPRPQAMPMIPSTLVVSSIENPSPAQRIQAQEESGNRIQIQESNTHKIQKLHSALSSVNPQYRPPGFTITSLSECSDGVLQDAIRATQVAVSTLLSAIAPGQETSLWQHVRNSMDRSMIKDSATNTSENQ